MFKNFILFVCLIIVSKSDKDYYLPMEKKSKYGDDVCRYYDDDHYYVRACEKGKYCARSLSSISYLEVCHDLPNPSLLSNLNDGKCTTTFECEAGLLCNGNTCTKCPSSNSVRVGEYSSYNCIPDSAKGTGFCEQVTLGALNVETHKYSFPESYKKCGKLTITEYPNTASDTYTGIYYVSLNEYTYIGTVPDGEYVSDMKLCESGFALAFYYGGLFDDPKSNSATVSISNHDYLRCVTPISINEAKTSRCSINYKIKDGEPLNYNVDRVSNAWNYAGEMQNLCNYEYIKIKSDNFRDYSKSISEEERKTCGDLDGENKYTCENNDLIKSWYFYKNPEKYILYNGREKLGKVLDYLIQKDYPSYSFSKFLNIKIIFLLLLFLL